MLDLPIADASVGVLACWYVLHHLPDADVARALGEFVRVLRPGGVLLIGGHVGESSTLKTEGYGGSPMRVFVNLRPADYWAAQVRSLGLTIEAHTVFDPDDEHPSHALFARVPVSPSQPV